MLKNYLVRWALSFSVFGILSCAHPSKEPSNLKEKELVLLGTTDFHASLENAEEFARAIRSKRKQFGESLLHLDGGDLFQGSLEGNLNKGRSIVAFYNLIGADAVAMGNHELDYGSSDPKRVAIHPGEDGLGNLRKRAKEAKFAWLSANFVFDGKNCDPKKEEYCNAEGHRTFFKPRVVFQKKPGRVCVIGATTPNTPNITRPAFVKGMRFDSLESVIPSEIKFFEENEKCDFIVLTTHAGLECAANGRCLEEGNTAEILNFLRKFPNQLDAVIAGHTHQKAQEVIAGTPVLEAGSRAKQIGILKIYPRAKRGEAALSPSHFEEWIPTDRENPALKSIDVSDVTKLLKPFRDEANKIKTKIIAELNDPFIHEYTKENALGNFVADSLKEAGKRKWGATMGITNPGGIRASWTKAGPLTYGDLFSALPFENNLAVAKLSGDELILLLEISTARSGPLFPISGLIVEKLDVAATEMGPWDRDLNGDGKMEVWERKLLVRATDDQGHAIDPKKFYKVATTDFLTSGAEYQSFLYSKIPSSRVQVYEGIMMRDAAEAELKRKKVLKNRDYYSNEKRRIFLVRPN